MDEAAMWAVRTAEPDFDDWAAFTEWLEASPFHSDAYDRAMLAAQDGAEMLGSLPANDADWSDEEEEERSLRRWVGPALAGCLAALAVLWLWPAGDADLTYDTAAGETRTVALGEGSSVILSGGTTLVVDADDPRQARLESGRAVFEIRHDEGDPFRLAVGDASLVDAGTVFDVNIRQSAVSVGVAEGAVIYDPGGPAARIDPGEVLSFERAGGAYRIESMPVEQVGEWRQGRLTFREAPLADVAVDLSRATGIEYRVAPAGGTRAISGSLAIEPLRRDPGAVGPLLGIEVRRDGDAWILDGG
ncbi:FecR family protein [Alteriqipengyuania lutimaris]|nr:FecR domain-containing protein [Alteriqipengyuania lutimaris]MBB3035436.1 transmembrane sensor [Alteriqipengyuania lutimaris]